MAITINGGTGVITGISVGGLPDGVVDAGTLATNSVDSDELINGAIDAGHLASGVGGKVLQAVSTTKTDTFSSTSDSFTDITGVSVNITPATTSSKILIWVDVVGFASADAYSYFFQLMRDSTAIAIGDSAGSRTRSTFALDTYGAGGIAIIQCGFHHLDSPSTTSQVTYKLQGKRSDSGAGTFYIGRNDDDGDGASSGRYPSTITVMEVAS